MMLNPILEKDMRTKMRGWRTPVLMSIYVLVLGLVLVMYFSSNTQLYGYTGYSTFNPRTAVDAYNTIALFQFGLLMLIVPAMTATAISGERERQTIDLMLCSDMSTWTLVFGKLMVSIAHIMLLVVASLPVLGMVFLFGGISFWEVLLLLVFYIVTALMAASLGIFFSTVFRKNVTAIISTYIGLGTLGLGPVIATFIWAIFYSRYNSATPTYGTIAAFLFPSPAFGFTSFIVEGSAGAYYIVGDLFGEIKNLARSDTGWLRHFDPWILNGLFNLALSAILLTFSAWKLKPVKGFGRKKRAGAGSGRKKEAGERRAT